MKALIDYFVNGSIEQIVIGLIIAALVVKLLISLVCDE